MPREFVEAAINNLEPTFAVGPILKTEAMATVKPLIPPPDIEGMQAEFVYREPAANGSPETYPEVEVPPVPPIGQLPKGRAVLTSGWMRMSKVEAP
jgi:hypothetical protein